MKNLIQKTLRHFGYELRRTRDAISLQKELIKGRDPVIFDVGAHVGSVARKYRQLFPLASIYCFEPFPPSFEQLLQNLEGDSRISCYKVAVSEKRGKAVLNANLSSSTNSLLATDPRGSRYWGEGLLDTNAQVEVDTTTIDCFFHENGISHIDILKLDVQGAEFAALNGATEVLSHSKVSLIYTELLMCPTYVGQHKLYEYLTLLDSYGYEFLDYFNPERSGKQLIQADIVFLNSSFKKALGNL